MRSEQDNSAQIAAFNRSLAQNRLIGHVQGCEYNEVICNGECGFEILESAVLALTLQACLDPDITLDSVKSANGYECIKHSVNDMAEPNKQGVCQALHTAKTITIK